MAYGKPKPPKKAFKMPKPTMKKRKTLSATQVTLLKEHKAHHSPKHMAMMRKSMKAGYCFQQAHDIAMGKVGK